MKKLILDYSTWRSGQDGQYATGKGLTKLLNNEDFMCCLGGWSLQLGASKEQIQSRNYPSGCPIEIELLTDGIHANSLFSDNAARINDAGHSTPAEKITLLTALCAEHGYELEVINEPVKLPTI